MSGKQIPLNEYITLQRGHDLPHKDRVDGRVPVVASTGIVGYHNQVKAKAPGVVIGRSGSIGGGQFITEDFWPLNTTLWVKDFKGHNERFVYFLLRSIDFTSFNVGSGVPTLNRNHLSSILVEDIGREAEDKVAKILGDIDDKIQINNRLNQTLEQLAQAIFKSWFVDFDPVKAKIAVLEAGGTFDQAELAAMSAISAKDEAALKQLQAEQPAAYTELAQTAALFPSKMVDSELGEIPEGWEVFALSSLVNLTGGGTPKRSEPSFWGGDVPWFSVRDVPVNGNIFVIDTEEKITELGLKKSSTRLLPQGTTIITARGTVGKLALLAKDMCMNQSCYGVSGKNHGPYFNYFYLSQAVSTLKQNTHGAVFDTITTSTFDTYRSSYCGKEISSRFEATITPLMEAIKNNLQENDSLSKSRDTLLPKLLSGELPIPKPDEASA